MLDWIDKVPAFLEFVVLLGAALGGAALIYKYIWKPVKQFNQKINRGMDTLLGYAPVLDPATGREIQAATPPLANRVHDLETSHTQIASALTTIAETQRAVLDLQEKWEARESAGQQIIEEWQKWRDIHEAEAQMREDRLAEWEAWRQEQTLMVESMKNIHLLPHKDVLD